MYKPGSLLVLGALLVAAACGSSTKNGDEGDGGASDDDVTDGVSDDEDDDVNDGSGATTNGGNPAKPGGAPNNGGTGGSGATAGRGIAGSGGAVGECATTKCGGDIVGTWEIQSSCLSSLMGVDSCSGLQGNALGLTQSGTITFDDGATYSSETTTTGTLELTYPEECLSGLTCEEVGVLLGDTLQRGFEVRECETVPQACVCTVNISQSNSESGTYRLSNGVLMQIRNGASVRSDYCVDGDFLTLSSGPTQSYLLERR